MLKAARARAGKQGIDGKISYEYVAMLWDGRGSGRASVNTRVRGILEVWRDGRE